MGWNNWNAFHCDLNERLVKDTADFFVSSGMRDAGYHYVNIDDCWALPDRDAKGDLVPDPLKFPSGIEALAAYVHSRSLRFGIYADAGTRTCSKRGGFPGSLGHEAQDARRFASWEVDYLKYDNCNNQRLPARPRYEAMRDALAATGRPIAFSICNWGEENPWEWGPETGHLWRTTEDIHDTWASMLSNFHKNVTLYAHAGPGAWNDPDMLEVGNGGMTTIEYQSHFSLWAAMAAPLLAGNNLLEASEETMSILLNREVIAVDQDPLGLPGRLISTNGTLHVLAKPLANGDRAVVLFNEGDRAAAISTAAINLGLPAASRYTLKDLWERRTAETDGPISAVVAAHGVVMYRVAAGGSGRSPASP